MIRGRPESQGDGHRHFIDDQIYDSFVTKEAFSKIESCMILDH